MFLAVINLVFDGSLFRLWKLHQDNGQIHGRIERLKAENANLEVRLREAKDPGFLEKVARERFDLVNERDLVFVFSDMAEDETL